MMPDYPYGIFHTAVLTNASQTVGPAGHAIKVRGFILQGGAAAEEVIFQNEANVEQFRVKLAIGEKVVCEIPFEVQAGLEVLTASAAGDVLATVFFVKG
jgi:hypothetical protein